MPRFRLFVLSTLALVVSVAAVRQSDAVVKIRDDSGANVTVVAWSSTRPQFGIRTDIARNGAATNWHSIWVAATALPEGPSAISRVVGAKRPLTVGGTLADAKNCYPGGQCTPPSYVAIQLRDQVLRSNKDSINVTVYTPSGSEWKFAIDGGVLQAYIAAVDSVSAGFKKK